MTKTGTLARTRTTSGNISGSTVFPVFKLNIIERGNSAVPKCLRITHCIVYAKLQVTAASLTKAGCAIW